MSDKLKVGDRVRLTNEAKENRTSTHRGDVTYSVGEVLAIDGEHAHVHWKFLPGSETWHERIEYLEKTLIARSTVDRRAMAAV